MENIEDLNEAEAPSSGGFMKFYGLYWKKEHIAFQKELLAGLPSGWTGRGTKSVDYDTLWMNFWGQKGIYVLYDSGLTPVYAGQAGLTRGKKKSDESGRCLGQRLRDHSRGKYRNGWEYFSWFGFLDCDQEKLLKGKLKTANVNHRLNVSWSFDGKNDGKDQELNLLLDSFEAILIEAFVPRFNSRGGNLKNAIYVDQFESTPKLRDQD